MFRVACAFTFLAALLTQSTTQAQPAKGSHDPHHGAFMDCARACDDCARICDACAAHCARIVADGKKDHLMTHQTCLDCATFCRAASNIVAKMGPFSDLICRSCAEACKRCGEACEKLAEDKMMKDCAAECRKCETACRDMVKHTGHAAGHAGK